MVSMLDLERMKSLRMIMRGRRLVGHYRSIISKWDRSGNPIPAFQFPGCQLGKFGRLINAYGEPLGDPQKPTGPTPVVLRRSPGLSLQAQQRHKLASMTA